MVHSALDTTINQQVLKLNEDKRACKKPGGARLLQHMPFHLSPLPLRAVNVQPRCAGANPGFVMENPETLMSAHVSKNFVERRTQSEGIDAGCDDVVS